MSACNSNAGGVALEQSCPAVPESVGAIRSSLGRFARAAGASPRTVDAVALAASEAATNVLRHACRDRHGVIEVIGVVAAGQLVVTVRGTGHGRGRNGDGAGLALGLSIIGRVADRLDLRRSPTGGAEVRMHFALAVER